MDTIEISNVTPKNDRTYYLYISPTGSKPSTTSSSKEVIVLQYDSSAKKFKTSDANKIANYVELNQDLYVNVIERESVSNENIVLYGKKIEKYAQPQYNNAFRTTFLSKDSNQIVLNFTHAKDNNRKLQIKVGKITDIAILNKIKSQDSSGFTDLLAFAKSNNGIYNQTLETKKDAIDIEYYAKENGNIKLTGLEADAYYFLYVKADGENGKYTSPEAVTLARASVTSDYWGMNFYGSSDFKWADFGSDTPAEEKKADQGDSNKKVYPNAGAGFGAIMLVVVIGVAIVAYKKYGYYRNIKY